MYLTCDACAFIGDGSAELGVGNSPPHAHEQDPVRDHAQEVAEQEVVARHDGREDERDVGEEGQRCGEAHPAVEVAAVAAIAKRESENRDGPEARQQHGGNPDVRALERIGVERARGRPRAEENSRSGGKDEGHSDSDGDERRSTRRGGRRSYGAMAMSPAPSSRAPIRAHAPPG